ncbi:peroxiredoxin-like protein [Zychaea mexicana]|uniref:peroxiredoxin-like protein n=1 Tax=Zychaea mexicana TaxID=64656 RepID=UPI0022FE4F32|nr:peroxiredoxin-like protein [Zychaea mexicana]KAI9495904.1 peroxiredoxin-like protein [Zychaea mexicana]
MFRASTSLLQRQAAACQRGFHSSTAHLIKKGDYLPSIVVQRKSPADTVDVQELFGSVNKAILFGVPGAFTPGCSKTHLPGYIKQAEQLKAEKGVDLIACVSVNDAFVMSAWADATSADGKVELLADSKGELAKAMDLDFDASGALGGHRFKRFAAVLEHGVVKELFVEQDKTGLNVSLVENVEKHL